MATLTVTSTADSGSGSLRQAINDAQSGDTIVFDDVVFPANTETTIYFNSGIEIQKSLTIDGGNTWTDNGELKTRVVLDLQEGAYRVFGFQSNGNYIYSLQGLTFYNGKNQSGGALYIRYGTLTITNSVFSTFASRYGGGVYAAAGHTTIINSYFKNVSATSYGGALYITAGTTTAENCTFASCSAVNGGAVYAVGSTINAFTNCSFINCSASATGAAYYISATSQNTLINCTFTQPINNNKPSIYNSGTNTDGSLIINGSITCDIVQLDANSTSVINGTITADVLTIGNGASVTFSGVDTILAVTTTATIGSATFTAAENSTGYIAAPDVSAFDSATIGANVYLAKYGSNVASISATIDVNVATFTISAASAGYIVEGSTDGGETWLSITITDGKATLQSAKAYKFRTFDGAFKYSAVVPRVYYLKTYDVDGDFATATDWTLDAEKTVVCVDGPTIKDGVFYCTEVDAES